MAKMLPLSRLPLSTPGNRLPSPAHASPPGPHACTYLATSRNKSPRPKWSLLPFFGNAQGWTASSSSKTAVLQSWQCCVTTQRGDQGIEPEGTPDNVPAQSDDQESEALQIMQSENGERRLRTTAPDRLALVEDKEEYIGKAIRAGKGALIAELLQIFNNLLERPYGGGVPVANAGGAVIERVINDVHELRGQEGVNDQILFELLKVIRLLEMDMELLRAARKEETLLQRLQSAQEHCKHAVAIASSF